MYDVAASPLYDDDDDDMGRRYRCRQDHPWACRRLGRRNTRAPPTPCVCLRRHHEQPVRRGAGALTGRRAQPPTSFWANWRGRTAARSVRCAAPSRGHSAQCLSRSGRTDGSLYADAALFVRLRRDADSGRRALSRLASSFRCRSLQRHSKNCLIGCLLPDTVAVDSNLMTSCTNSFFFVPVCVAGVCMYWFCLRTLRRTQ